MRTQEKSIRSHNSLNSAAAFCTTENRASKADRICIICLAAVLLTIGSAIYLLFRPTSLLMFHWADSIGLMGLLNTLRANSHGASRRLFPWVIYSLPFALWVLSYMLCIKTIWWRSSGSSWYHTWFWCVPVVSIASELCQRMRILPGTFDPVDLIALSIAAACGLGVLAFERRMVTVKQVNV